MEELITHGRFLGGLAAAVATICLSAQAPAAQYEFVTIVDSSGPLDVQLDLPSINNAGVVAFRAGIDAGGSGVFASSGGPITTIADTNGPIFNAFNGAISSINSAGVVVFHGFLDAGGRGIFTGSGGPTSTISDSISSSFNSYSLSPSINDDGTVAFFGDEGVPTGIYTSNGGPITTVATSSGPIFLDFNSLAWGPSINNDGTAAFRASLDAGGSGIFTGNGGAPTTIADSSGTFADFGHAPSINNAGNVAFHANLDAGGSGIYTGSGGAITTIADTSGDFVSFFRYPSINSAGTVAFVGFYTTDDGVFPGIYTGPDLIADKVIATGDALDGSTVVQLDFFREGLNDSGQVAFYARLSDGRQGIFRADPVPEPSSLTLLGTWATLGLWRRKWNRSD